MQQLLQKNTARLALALGAAVLVTGCVAIPGEPYYDNGGGYGYGAPGYFPGTSAVTVYEQPGVIYTAPPPGWRAEAWREHQWRESRERDRQREYQRNERERRDWERRREAERREMDRRRDAERRDIERQREAQRREAERRREADREQAHRPPRDYRPGRSLEDALRDDALRRQQWQR